MTRCSEAPLTSLSARSLSVAKIFISCVALPDVTEASWTEEVKDAVDHFILDSSVTTLLLYVDAESKLRAEHTIGAVVGSTSCFPQTRGGEEPRPPHVSPSFSTEQHEQNLLFYFIRHPGADVSEETFTTAVQFGNARGDAPNRLLTDMTWLHGPAVALTPFRDKSIKDNYHYHMHGLLAFFTGQRKQQSRRGLRQ